jgi:fatty acid desaturase
MSLPDREGGPQTAMNTQYLRYLLGSSAMIAALAAIMSGGAAIWIVTIAVIAVGGPADEALGDEDSRLSDAQRVFFNANLYATLPLLALMTVAMLHLVAGEFRTGLAAELPRLLPEVLPDWGPGGKVNIAVAVVLTGYCYAVFGATVGHELTHRTGILPAYLSARGLFAFTFNTSFTIFHVHGHHRQVATFRDPATARRGEYILAFVVRTVIWQFMDALAFEAARARRLGFAAYGLRNRVVSGQLYSLAVIVVAALLAGWPGVLAFLATAYIGRLLHELVNYVQHFGLVRVEDQPVEPRHTWDCKRLISNVLHYNLPMHADHHMFASRPFWQLKVSPKAPLLPFGYQTMVFVAMVPRLWRRTMRPLLAEWDKLASDEERALIRQRDWEGVV